MRLKASSASSNGSLSGRIVGGGVDTTATATQSEEGETSLFEMFGGGRTEDWRKTPFAVGPAKATWADEDQGCGKACAACWCGGSNASPETPATNMLCTAFFCSRLGAGRVGNMIVLWQSPPASPAVEGDRQPSPAAAAPILRLVVGPYWAVAFGVTVPFLLLASVLTFYQASLEDNLAVLAVWSVSTLGLLLSLLKVSCTNPGILPRHAQRPWAEADEDPWIWNDQAHTFRPKHARFDPEIQAVVERYDHFCPWTGTAIGAGQLFWFRVFLAFLLTTIIVDGALLTLE
jgi:hypothetical protein